MARILYGQSKTRSIAKPNLGNQTEKDQRAEVLGEEFENCLQGLAGTDRSLPGLCRVAIRKAAKQGHVECDERSRCYAECALYRADLTHDIVISQPPDRGFCSRMLVRCGTSQQLHRRSNAPACLGCPITGGCAA